MRKERDGETTKQQVIEAAKDVFAESGFAGASLGMISAKSGISSGLILHHFKSKENLYQVVLESLAAEYARALTQAGVNIARPEEAMLAMLQAAFQYWNQDSAYLKISTWAYLENRAEFVAEEEKLTAALAQKIQDMQAAGKFDPRVSSFVLLSMTIGPIQFWMRHRELFREALKLDQPLDALNEVFLRQYLALIQKIYQPE
jgi:AcrR family transcriptional regulator